jgi:cysteinyl-tRNA synthetase
MGKSLGNFISLDQFFKGEHPLLQQAYSPMIIRFFMLQAHYRSTLDFSNEALQAAQKGMERLFKSIEVLDSLSASTESTVDIASLKAKCYDAMNDDFNSPIVIANLFDGVRIINSLNDGNEKINAADLVELKKLYYDFVFDILGLQDEQAAEGNNEVLSDVVDLLLNLRMEAKANKDWAMSDKIRNELTAFGFEIKDKKDGFDWELKK